MQSAIMGSEIVEPDRLFPAFGKWFLDYKSNYYHFAIEISPLDNISYQSLIFSQYGTLQYVGKGYLFHYLDMNAFTADQIHIELGEYLILQLVSDEPNVV